MRACSGCGRGSHRVGAACLCGERHPASALGFSPPVVVDDGPDADDQAVGMTGCPDGARILEAWSWEQVVGSLFACPIGDFPVCKFDNSEISAVELGSSC